MTVSYKDIKLNNPAGRKTTDNDDTPDTYQDMYTAVFIKIIDGEQEYLLHWFKNFQTEPLKSFLKFLDYKQWSPSFRGSGAIRKFGIEEISNLAQFYLEALVYYSRWAKPCKETMTIIFKNFWSLGRDQ